MGNLHTEILVLSMAQVMLLHLMEGGHRYVLKNILMTLLQSTMYTVVVLLVCLSLFYSVILMSHVKMVELVLQLFHYPLIPQFIFLLFHIQRQQIQELGKICNFSTTLLYLKRIQDAHMHVVTM